MKTENKTEEKSKDVEEPCCADPNNCSGDSPPKLKKIELRCSCGGFCG